MPVIKLFGFSGCTFSTSTVDDDATKTVQRDTVLYALLYNLHYYINLHYFTLFCTVLHGDFSTT